MTKPVSTIGRHPRLRRRLTVTTALAGFLAATPAWAQTQPTLPGRDQVKGTTPGSGSIFKPDIDLKGNKLDVTLHARNTVINWDGFNVPENGTAKFNSDFVNSVRKIAVLNRDVSGNQSQILGKLSSSSNVAVWILNPSGIMVGSKANINTGSLVLSTLQIDDGDFLDGNGKFALSVKDQATKLSGITVGQGAKINVAGGNRGLVMVAPKIDAYGTFDAHDQTVAFVTASDVEFTFSDGSPLSVKINSGTAVSGRSQFVRGTVDGADAVFALASQGTITNSLLQVDANVTTATSGTRGIVLSAGRVKNAIDGVAVAGGTANTTGLAKLTVGGSLTTNDNDGSDILAGATRGASFTGALSSRRDIRVAGGGNVTVAGAVTAGGDYSVDGLNVTLGKSTIGEAETVLQQANGAVDITAVRALAGVAGLTLVANANGSDQNPEALTLAATFDGVQIAPDGTSTRVPSGAIKFAPGTTLKGGSDRESSVRIRSGTINGAVLLGNVVGRDLLGAIGTADFTSGIARQSALALGDVSLAGQVKLDGTAITTGALTSTNDAVTLKSGSGNITTRAIQAAKTVTINTGGTLSTAAINAGGAVTADATGAASFGGDVNARGDLAIRAASVALNGKTGSTGAIDLLSRSGAIAAQSLKSSKATNMTSAGSLSTKSVISGGALTANAAGGASFAGDVSAQGDLAVKATSIGLAGTTSANGGVDLTSTSGAITTKAIQSTKTTKITSARILSTGSITSGGDMSVTAVGMADFAGDVSSQGDLGIRAASIGLTGKTSANGALGLTSASGAITTKALQSSEATKIASAGLLSTGSITSGGDTSISATGAAAFVGDVSSQGDLAVRAGSISLIGKASTKGTLDLTTRTGAIAVTAIESTEAATITSGGALTTGGIVSGGFLSVDAVGAASFVGDVASQGDLALRAASIDLAGRTSGNGAITLLGRTGAIGTRDLQAAKAVTITSGAALNTGAIKSGGAITADATGNAFFDGDVTAADDLVLRGTAIRLIGREAKSGGTIDLQARVGGIFSDGGVALTSTSSDTADFIRLQAAGTQGIDLSENSVITAGANQALRVAVRNETKGAALILGDVTAKGLVGLSAADGDPATMGAPIVSSGSLTFGDLQLVEGFSASSTAGDLNVASIAVTGAGRGISLSAPVGKLTVQSLVLASGDVTLSGGAAINLDTVESNAGRVSVTSSDAVDLGTLVGAKGVTATGTSVTVDSVRGGTIGITTTAGALTLGDVNGAAVALNAVGGDISVSGPLKGSSVSVTGTDAIRVVGAVEASGGDIRLRAGAQGAFLLGGAQAAGDYSVTGGSVTLGGRHEAKGAVSIVSTDGMIAGASGLVITSDTDGVGAEALSLKATGGTVALAANSSLSGGRQSGSAVSVTTDSGNVALGNVTAKTLSIAGTKQPIATITTGNLSLSSALTAAAAEGITTGAIDVAQGGVMLDGGTGTVRTGAITAGKAVSLTGGSITHSAIAGSGVILTATSGDVTGGDIASTGRINVNAALGKITVGRLDASGPGGNVTLASGGTLFATGVTADGTASVTAANAGADVLLAEGLTANGAVSVAAGRDIRAPFIRSLAGALTVSAPNGDALGYQPGTNIDLEAGPEQAFSLTVGRAADLGNVAGGPISITAASIEAGSINAGGNAVSLAASKGDLTISGDIVAGKTSLTATGMTSLKSVTASGALTLSGGAGIRFTNVSGTAVNASSGGTITGDGASAVGALTVTGDSLSLGRASAGDVLGVTATGGDATLGTLSAGGDLTILAAGRAALNGDVDAGGSYSVTGASVALGDRAVTQKAAGPITITAKSGDIGSAAGLNLTNASSGGGAKSTIVLDSAGAIALAGSTLRTDGILGLRAGAGRTVELGQIDVGALGGFDGVTAGGTFAHSGSMTTGDIGVGSIDVAITSGDLKIGAVIATGAVRLAAATGDVTSGALRGASIDLAAGDVLLTTSLDTPGAAALAGGDIRVDTVRAGSIGIRTTGALTGNADGRASLTSTAGDTVVEAGDMRIGAIDAAGALSLTGGAIDAAGKLTASREMLVKARAALAMGDASAGTDLTLSATDAIAAGTLTAGGAVAVNGRGVTIADARSGGALALTSGADLRLGTGQATGVATIDAVGTAFLGALSAGPSITVRAADAELTGAQRASMVTFQNSAATLTAMRLGDDTGAGGFRLSNAEVGLVNADAVRFDQGAGAVQVGTLSFGADTGRRTVDLLTTGAIAVDGVVTGGGLGRVFRVGGDAADGAATDIRVAATSDAGGRLLFNDADLDLRADRIAVGLASGFLDLLTPGAAGLAQALALIGDGNSALYNAGLGGGFYDPAATVTVSAHTLNVRFADFALFQNTGVPGQFAGAVLGGTLAAPVMPALRVSTTGVTGNSGFAIFGTINGAGDANAALLGSGVIDIDPVLLPNSRINGCLAGSGTGCLTTIVIQPVLQIFDWSSEDVFGVAQNVSTPFDPGVGGNNEELLTGLPALAPDQQTSAESPKQ